MPQPLNTNNSLESNFSQVNGLMTDVKNDRAVRVIKDDTGTPVVILSKDGLQTTAPNGGIDVTNATNAQYTFNSNQNVLKVVSKNSTTVSVANNSTLIRTVTHNLGYIPVVLAYLNAGGSNWTPLPYAAPTASTPLTFNLYIYVINITSTTFEIWTTAGNPGSSTLNITYYLLQETVTT